MDPDEVTSSTIVKDGKDGKSPLAKVVDNNNGTHTVQVGLDKNGNGELDPDEVTSSTIVKDGKAGATGATGATGAKGDKGETGATGAKGEDGKPSLAQVVDNNDGTHTVKVGLDKNGNGQLDPDEVTSSTIVKDGKDGKSPLAKSC